ncbi:MAG: hypothetical protein AAF694_31440 [Bacteroidota bacterium]
MKNINFSWVHMPLAILFVLGTLACEQEYILEPNASDALPFIEREGQSSPILPVMANTPQDSCFPLICPFHHVDFLINSSRQQGNTFHFQISLRFRQNLAYTYDGILQMNESVCDSIWDVWGSFEGKGGSGLVPTEAINRAKQSGSNGIQTRLGVLQTNGPTGKIRTFPFWLDVVFKPSA